MRLGKTCHARGVVASTNFFRKNYHSVHKDIVEVLGNVGNFVVVVVVVVGNGGLNLSGRLKITCMAHRNLFHL